MNRSLMATLLASVLMAACGSDSDSTAATDSASPVDTGVLGDIAGDGGLEGDGDAPDATDDADATADTTAEASVVVTAPAAGGYTVGDTLEVAWATIGAETVTLSLVVGDQCLEREEGVVIPVLAYLQATTTTFLWTVPTTLAPGEYRVRVRATTSALVSSVACSPTFLLLQPPGCEELGCALLNRACSSQAGVATCGTCNEGYTESDGVCVVVDCGSAPPVPENATLTGLTSAEFGGLVSYRCEEGYTVSGDTGGPVEITRRCGATGLWEAPSGVCQPVRCGANPAPVRNALLQSVDRTTFGGQASYLCEAGFEVPGTGQFGYTLMCGATGSWSPSPTCEPVDCGALSNPTNGSVSTPGGTSLGASATYTCATGFSLSAGSTTRTCGASGAWSGSAGVCTPVDCGTPPAISNGTRTSSSTTFNSSATYTCNSGYTRSGPDTLTCSASGSWGTAPTCIPVDCGGLSNPANGSVSTPAGTTLGATATYSCNAGYTFSGGSTSRVCGATGAWSGSEAVCAVDCLTPPNVTNGTRSFTTTTTGSTATYTCNSGYTRSGSATLTCSATGSWGTAPTCTPVNCGGLANPANGAVTTASGTSLGAVARYTCDTGYTRSGGSATRTCDPSGTWSGSAAVCTLVDCGPPPAVSEGSRSFTSTTWGSTADYACNAGYARSGAATLTCDATGSWGTVPTCDDVNECDSPGAVCTSAYNVCANTAGSWQCACAGGYTGLSIIGGNTTCEPGLGGECTSDSQCPADTWCSTVAGYRRCSPRVFDGAAHQMDFVFVPAGTFLQGTPGATNQERPYTATLTRNYFVSRTEVTQGQWKAATGGINPSCFQSGSGAECSTANANDVGPVEQVDWYSAMAYANWLSVNEGLSACYTFRDCTDATSDWYDGTHPSCTNATFTGLDCTGYRLLIEPEWEQAVRGGTTSTYFWGEATDTATIGLYAWFIGNSLNRTQLVGGKQVNPYGLHDMSGNVSEWLFDCIFSTTFTRYPVDSATDHIEPPSSLSCAIRGGRWSDSASNLRSAGRAANRRSEPNRFIGFRLARTAY